MGRTAALDRSACLLPRLLDESSRRSGVCGSLKRRLQILIRKSVALERDWPQAELRVSALECEPSVEETARMHQLRLVALAAASPNLERFGPAISKAAALDAFGNELPHDPVDADSIC